MSDFIIQGLSTALPRFSIEQQDAATLAAHFYHVNGREARLLPALYRRSGVKRRFSVLLNATQRDPSIPAQDFYPQAASETDRGPGTAERMRCFRTRARPLALDAARRAMTDAGVSPGQIHQVIVVTCSGFYSPGLDLELIQDLGLSPATGRTIVGFMGCHGAINGMRVAQALASQSPGRILVCAVELCSLHFQYSSQSDHMVANALFADGAAALVGGQPADSTRQSDSLLRIKATGSCLLPDSADAMTWSIGDNGFAMTLSPRVPDLIRTHLRPWLESWLHSLDCSIDRIGGWAVHPGGTRILGAVEDALGLRNGELIPSRQILQDHGNMSSPTVLFILDALARAQTPRPYLALAFGPGLTAEAALIL